MSLRRRIALTAAAFAILLLAWGADTFWNRRAADLRLEQKRLTTLAPEEFRALTIDNGEAARIRLVLRKAGEWWMAEPLQARADRKAVETLVGNLANAVRHHSFPRDEAADLDAYGLKAPAIRLSFEGEAADGGRTERRSLAIGRASSTGQYYATFEDEGGEGGDIFAINGYLRNLINRDVMAFRDKSLLPFEPARVRRVLLKNRYDSILLKKDGASGEWEMARPHERPADRRRVEELLGQLALGRVIAFEDQPASGPAELGLDPPRIEVTLISDAPGGGAETATLRIGRYDASRYGHYAAREGSGGAILAPDRVAEALSIRAGDLRRRALFAFAPEDVVALESRVGEEETVFVKGDDGRWRFSGDATRRVDQRRLSAFVFDLATLEAFRFVEDDPDAQDLRAFGLLDPRQEFTLHTRPGGRQGGEERLFQLRLGRRHDDLEALYARTSESPGVVAVSLDAPGQFVVTADRFTDHRLFPDFNLAATRGFDLGLGERRLRLERDSKDEKAWRLSEPGAGDGREFARVDARDVAILAESLREVESLKRFDDPTAEEFLALKDRMAKSFGAPLAEIEIESNQGEKRALTIGATRGGENAMFVKTGEGPALVYSREGDEILSAVERIVQYW